MSTTIKNILILILFMSSILCHFSFAEAAVFKAIEILSGVAKSELKREKDSSMIPFIIDLDFDLKPLLNKVGINPPMLTEFQVEPFLSYVYSPRDNLEVGGSIVLKMGLLPEDYKFQPYVKIGGGVLFMSQHVREQATQFNFIDQLGAGAHYFLNKNLAITLDFRFRHLSNCGLKHPNHGINSLFFVAGTTYRF